MDKVCFNEELKGRKLWKNNLKFLEWGWIRLQKLKISGSSRLEKSPYLMEQKHSPTVWIQTPYYKWMMQKKTTPKPQRKTDQRNKKTHTKATSDCKEGKKKEKKEENHRSHNMAYSYLLSIKMSTGWDTAVASLIQCIHYNLVHCILKTCR